jgi:hypothetical protein
MRGHTQGQVAQLPDGWEEGRIEDQESSTYAKHPPDLL